YVAVLSASPPVNPSVVAASDVPTTLVRNAIFATSQPIDRHQLMDAPTVIVLNITVDSPFASYWSVGNVTLSGQPLMWHSLAAVTGSWHLITLQPPPDGWVGSGGLSLFYVDRVLLLEVTLGCGASPFLSITIAAPSPGLERTFPEQVKTATQSTQIVSIFGGSASSGAALARSMTI
ncbi:Hypothetical protein, putative, partial [Bodo saltans]